MRLKRSSSLYTPSEARVRGKGGFRSFFPCHLSPVRDYNPLLRNPFFFFKDIKKKRGEGISSSLVKATKKTILRIESF